MSNSFYITDLHLKDYKSIRDVTISLNEGLNIIIGANGSGKTNFLEILEIILLKFPFLDISEAIDYGLVLFQSDNTPYKLETRASSETGIQETFLFKNNSLLWSIENSHYFDKSVIPPALSIKFSTPNFNDLFSNTIAFTIPFKQLYYSRNYPRKDIKFSNKIISHNIKEKNVNWNNLSQYFDIEESFIEKLALYSPIKNIRIPKELIRQYQRDNIISVENIIIEFFVNGKWWSWNHLSDGTKRLFYIISSIAAPYTDAKLILLEEPELGIHPQQLNRLMDFLRMEADEKQIIITTHSPQVLNELKENELDRIIITNYSPEKGTTLSHLSEEDKTFALSYMKEGAFLSDYWVQSGFSQEQTEIY